MPPIILAATSNVNDDAKPQPNPDNKNITAAMMIDFFLPILSLIIPVVNTPMMLPNNPLLTNQPSETVVKENCVFTKLMAPEITAVSNPNNKPPSATAKQI